MGAGSPHPVQEWNHGHRERRRGHRQGHRQALHLRLLSMELGSRRRLHRPAGRHHRSKTEIPYRKGEQVLMHVKRFSDAKPYEAPNHRSYTSLRLFGAEAGGTKGLVFGYSHFLPGGGAGPDASPPEKVYFVLRGELTVIVNGKETVLKANDSCVIEPNETREIINRGNVVCSIVVAVANPPK